MDGGLSRSGPLLGHSESMRGGTPDSEFMRGGTPDTNPRHLQRASRGRSNLDDVGTSCSTSTTSTDSSSKLKHGQV
jgi:hypothetical protein